jgi:hypothetical protein
MRLDADRLGEIAAELATKPKHEKVRALLYELLTAGLGAASTDVELEKPVPEVLPGMWLEFALRDLQRLKAI